jgi:Bardet-Biedl syndrome 4 protein
VSVAIMMKTTSRISQNWYIHLLYTRKDFNECLKVIEEQLKACNGQSDYALYIKGKL